MKFILNEYNKFNLSEKLILVEKTTADTANTCVGKIKSDIDVLSTLEARYTIWNDTNKLSNNEQIDSATWDEFRKTLKAELDSIDKNWSKNVPETDSSILKDGVAVTDDLLNKIKEAANLDAAKSAELLKLTKEVKEKFNTLLKNINSTNAKDDSHRELFVKIFNELSEGDLNIRPAFVEKNFFNNQAVEAKLNKMLEKLNSLLKLFEESTSTEKETEEQQNTEANTEEQQNVETDSTNEKIDWKTELLNATKNNPDQVDSIWEEAYKAMAIEISGNNAQVKNIVDKLKTFGERLRKSLMNDGFSVKLNKLLGYLSTLYKLDASGERFNKLSWQAFAAIDEYNLNRKDLIGAGLYKLYNIIFWTDFISRTTLDFTEYLKCQKELSLENLVSDDIKNKIDDRYASITGDKNIAFLYDIFGAGTSPFVKDPQAVSDFNTADAKLKNETAMKELKIECNGDSEKKENFDIEDSVLKEFLSDNEFTDNFNILKWFILHFCTNSSKEVEQAVSIAKDNSIIIDTKNIYPTLKMSGIIELSQYFNKIDTAGKVTGIFNQLAKVLGKKDSTV